MVACEVWEQMLLWLSGPELIKSSERGEQRSPPTWLPAGASLWLDSQREEGWGHTNWKTCTFTTYFRRHCQGLLSIHVHPPHTVGDGQTRGTGTQAGILLVINSLPFGLIKSQPYVRGHKHIIISELQPPIQLHRANVCPAPGQVQANWAEMNGELN